MFLIAVLLLLACVECQQEPIFLLPNLMTTKVFKGLPKLPDLNIGDRRAIYYYEQIVAIVDIAEGKKLNYCELIEVYEPSEAEELLKNLSTISKPNRLSFKDIMKLMNKCDKLDDNPARALSISNVSTKKSQGGNPLLAGIVPGTKWCGTGDIAKNYHDLGSRTKIDRCCRAHDLCPVKIRAYKKRYKLINNSFFSKSHCACDETFYNCLKNIHHVSADIIGNIYFNFAQPPCIEDESSANNENLKKFVPMKKEF